MASIPYNIIRKCKICQIEHRFEHIKNHISPVIHGDINYIMTATKDKEKSLTKLMELDQQQLQLIWEKYAKMFLQTKVKDWK